MSIKLCVAVVFAAVVIHRAAAAQPQLSFPVLPTNLCSLNAHSTVGMDGSVLLRRNVPPDSWPVDQLCDVHLFDANACIEARNQVVSVMNDPSRRDELAWIALPTGNLTRNSIGRIIYNDAPLLLIQEATPVTVMTEGGTFELLTAPLHARAEECMQRFVKWAKMPASDGYITALRIIQRNTKMKRASSSLEPFESQLPLSIVYSGSEHKEAESGSSRHHLSLCLYLDPINVDFLETTLPDLLSITDSLVIVVYKPFFRSTSSTDQDDRNAFNEAITAAQGYLSGTRAELLLVEEPENWIAPRISPDGRLYFSNRGDHMNDTQNHPPFEVMWCRWQGTKRLREKLRQKDSIDPEWLLFLNADEVLDTARFSEWWMNGNADEFDVVQLAANVYHDNDPLTPVGPWNLGGLLVREAFATRAAVMYSWDRYFYMDPLVTASSTRISLLTLDSLGKPMVSKYLPAHELDTSSLPIGDD